jgi:hypothetical protein
MLASLAITARFLLFIIIIISEDFGLGYLKPVIVGPYYLLASL